MKEFQLKIASSDKLFYEGPCVSLVIPVWDGEFAFLANHQDCVAAVSLGTLRFTKPDGQVVQAVCGLGMVRFESNTALVLAETIERPEDIDVVRARRAAEAAAEELKESISQQEYSSSQAALARALYRLRAAGKYTESLK